MNPVSPDNDRFIEEVEELIVSKTEHKYAEIVKETLGGITGEDGKINANGLWKQTRKIFPKHKDPIPMALEDNNGNIITNYNLIKKFALDEIVKRLSKRPMHPNLRSLEKAKTRLAKLRLRIATRRKSQPWIMSDMEKAI